MTLVLIEDADLVNCYEELGFEHPYLQHAISRRYTVEEIADSRPHKEPTDAEIVANFRELILMHHPESPYAVKPVVLQQQAEVKKEEEEDEFSDLERSLSVEQSASPIADSLPPESKQPTAGEKFVQRNFAKIYFSFTTLIDPHKRYLYSHPKADYLAVNLPGFVLRFWDTLWGAHKRREQRAEWVKKLRDAAVEKAPRSRKAGAFVVSLFVGIGVFLAALITSALLITAFAALILGVWVLPNSISLPKGLIPKTLKHYLGIDLDEIKNITAEKKPEEKISTGKIALAKLVGMVAFIALTLLSPLIAIGLIAGAFVSGWKFGRHAYKELAARGFGIQWCKSSSIKIDCPSYAMLCANKMLFPPESKPASRRSSKANVLSALQNEAGIASAPTTPQPVRKRIKTEAQQTLHASPSVTDFENLPGVVRADSSASPSDAKSATDQDENPNASRRRSSPPQPKFFPPTPQPGSVASVESEVGVWESFKRTLNLGDQFDS